MRRVVLLWAALALGAACDRGPSTSPGDPGTRTEVGDAAPASPAAPRPEPRATGRVNERGDRHARAAARQAAAVRRVEGTLGASTDDGHVVVIRRRNAPALTLLVGPKTAVTLDGRSARADALPEGAEVRASYEAGTGGRPAALSLDVDTRRRSQ